MSDLKIGVIGVAGRGTLAKHAHKPNKGSVLVAGADINNQALKDFKEKYNAFTTNDYKELLKQDIDAVFVTSPDFLHEEHTIAALNAGKHVYCEKPIAITIKSADRMLRAAKKNNVRLFLGHNMRYMSFVKKMKEIVDSGKIGEIKSAWCRHFVGYGGDAYFKDWHSERKYSTSLLLQKGAHDIDVIHWIAGGYTKRVVAFGNLSVYDKCERRKPTDPPDVSWSEDNWPPLSQKGLSPKIDVEDQSMILMELDNGVMATYLQNHFTPDSWRNYTFIGTHGRIENIGDYGEDGTAIRIWTKRTHFKEQGDEEIIVKPYEGTHGGADPKIVEEFIQFAKHGGKTSASAIAARYSVAAGYLGAKSLRNGGKPYNIPQVSKDIISYFENY